MINNRQNGRRRGRGGGQQRPQGGGGQRDSGNRIDSRARGNATQLHEKYKNLARDAQMSGDRVNTEYYLQFADHYFRVLADQRGRNEDQGQRRNRDDFDQDDDFGFEGEPVRADEQTRAAEDGRRDGGRRDDGRADNASRGDGYQRDGARRDGYQRDGYQRDRDGNRDQNQRDDSQRDSQRDGQRDGPRDQSGGYGSRQRDGQEQRGDDRPAFAGTGEGEQRPVAAEPKRRGRPRKQAEPTASGDAPDSGFDAALLPPSLGISVANDAEPEADAPKPRRRRTAKPTAAAADAAE